MIRATALSLLLIGASTLTACAPAYLTPVPARDATAAPSSVTVEPASLWNLTSHLTAQQLAVNAEVYAGLAPDPCASENEFDALVRAWVDRGTPADLERLADFSRDSTYGREGQAAAGRGYIHLAQKALAAGDHATAARYALNIYLSSTPHRVRLEALRIHCQSGNPQRIAREIHLVETGQQDARFQPLLPEMRAGLAARKAALEAAAESQNTPTTQSRKQ